MQISGVLIPQTDAPVIATIASLNAGTAHDMGTWKKFSITAFDTNMEPVAFQLAYGDSSIVATAASEMFPPGKFTMSTAMWTHLSVFNPTSANLTYCIARIANT